MSASYPAAESVHSEPTNTAPHEQPHPDPIPSLSDFEHQKENIIPLPQGRSASTLSTLFSTSDDHSHLASLETVRTALEAEIHSTPDDADDPLDPHHRYVKWIQEHYPAGHPDLMRGVERAVRKFKGDGRYRNDPRYLRLWILVARHAREPVDVFKYLSVNEIGTEVATLYEEYAGLMETLKRFREANEIFQRGIEKKAQPLERLNRKYLDFQRRIITPQDTDLNGPFSDATTTERARPALVARPTSVTVRSTIAPRQTAPPSSRPVAAMAGSMRSRGIPGARTTNAKIEVYRDDASTASPSLASQVLPSVSSANPWPEYGTEAGRRKENTKEATAWKGVTLAQKGRPKLPPGTKFDVYRDEEAISGPSEHVAHSENAHVLAPKEVPRRLASTSSLLESIDADSREPDPQPADGPSGSAPYLLTKPKPQLHPPPQQPPQPPTGPTKRPEQLICDLSMIYIDNEEYSFEELRAARIGYIHVESPPRSLLKPKPEPSFPESSHDGFIDTGLRTSFRSSNPKPINKSKQIASPTINTKAALKDVFEMFNQPLQCEAGGWEDEDETISGKVFKREAERIGVFRDADGDGGEGKMSVFNDELPPAKMGVFRGRQENLGGEGKGKMSVFRDEAPANMSVFRDEAPAKMSVFRDEAPTKMSVFRDGGQENASLDRGQRLGKIDVFRDGTEDRMNVFRDDPPAKTNGGSAKMAVFRDVPPAKTSGGSAKMALFRDDATEVDTGSGRARHAFQDENEDLYDRTREAAFGVPYDENESVHNRDGHTRMELNDENERYGSGAARYRHALSGVGSDTPSLETSRPLKPLFEVAPDKPPIRDDENFERERPPLGMKKDIGRSSTSSPVTFGSSVVEDRQSPFMEPDADHYGAREIVRGTGLKPKPNGLFAAFQQGRDSTDENEYRDWESRRYVDDGVRRPGLGCKDGMRAGSESVEGVRDRRALAEIRPQPDDSEFGMSSSQGWPAQQDGTGAAPRSNDEPPVPRTTSEESRSSRRPGPMSFHSTPYHPSSGFQVHHETDNTNPFQPQFPSHQRGPPAFDLMTPITEASHEGDRTVAGLSTIGSVRHLHHPGDDATVMTLGDRTILNLSDRTLSSISGGDDRSGEDLDAGSLGYPPKVFGKDVGIGSRRGPVLKGEDGLLEGISGIRIVDDEEEGAVVGKEVLPGFEVGGWFERRGGDEKVRDEDVEFGRVENEDRGRMWIVEEVEIPNPCNPTDPAIVETILARVRPPLLEQYRNMVDCRSLPSSIGKTLDRCNKATERSAGRGGSRYGRRGGEDALVSPGSGIFELPMMGRFRCLRKLGEGGYAKVYLVKELRVDTSMGDDDDEFSDDEDEDDEDGQQDQDRVPRLTALKIQSPPTPIEFYILSILKSRLAPRISTSIVKPLSCHIFDAETCTRLLYAGQGTLLDCVNAASREGYGSAMPGVTGGGLDELLAAFWTIEIMRTIEAVHASGIIHGDVKIDNLMMRIGGDDGDLGSQYSVDGSGGWDGKGVVLIDWGASVDLRAFPSDQMFLMPVPEGGKKGRKGDPSVESWEIRNGVVWRGYEGDWYGVAGVIHVLLFGRYMEVVEEESSEGGISGSGGRPRLKLVASFKRYWQVELWKRIFDLLLNSSGYNHHHPSTDGGDVEEWMKGSGSDYERLEREFPVVREIREVRRGLERWVVGGSCKAGRSLRSLVRRVEIAALERGRR